jgi:2-polyprenyl-6-methoxyphenol hydroxylase-like FAD-dependent oxidoreductase
MPSILRRITVTFTTVNFCYPLDMKTRRVDIAVVGGGPTGLLLAGDLVLNGVGVVVIERRTEPDQTPKAGGLGVLAGEVLERRGLGAALDAEEAAALEAMKAMRMSLAAPAGGSAKPAGSPPAKFGKFADLNLIDPKLQREPERRMRGVNQQALDRILTEHANARAPGTVPRWFSAAVRSTILRKVIPGHAAATIAPWRLRRRACAGRRKGRSQRASALESRACTSACSRPYGTSR